MPYRLVEIQSDRRSQMVDHDSWPWRCSLPEKAAESSQSLRHTPAVLHTHTRLTHTHVPRSSTQPQIIVVPCCWSSGVLGRLVDYQEEVLGFWDWMGETLETHW